VRLVDQTDVWVRGLLVARQHPSGSFVSRSTPTRRLTSDTLLASHVIVQFLCTPSSTANRICKTDSSCLRLIKLILLGRLHQVVT
jgi:hypothetical protein